MCAKFLENLWKKLDRLYVILTDRQASRKEERKRGREEGRKEDRKGGREEERKGGREEGRKDRKRGREEEGKTGREEERKRGREEERKGGRQEEREKKERKKERQKERKREFHYEAHPQRRDLAHINAGKTTVSERMLKHAGMTRVMGSVDDGDTVMDFMDQRERGITINSAAISFSRPNAVGAEPTVPETIFNLIDTPGHVDFTLRWSAPFST